MPAHFDEHLDPHAGCGTVTDDELAELQDEIARDVTTTLMFGTGRPEREARRVTKLARAEVYLRSLCCQLLSRPQGAGHLARLAEDPSDIDGAVYFGCLLHLAGEPEGAMWWWQFAAGAGDATAAYCLYLHHLHHGELRDAEHWMRLALTADNEIDFTPPPYLRPPVDLHSGFLRRAVDLLKVENVAGAQFHHPDHRLAVQVEDLDGVCC
ncbi:hypothetical protein AB0G67_43865 [Streptomyces sp. NPDC021056]|uniref:hypothetical protein n=1 Tax=Streptomyces sp. NPDC021056 TaxID=3155012 RepID=UPI0033C79618